MYNFWARSASRKGDACLSKKPTKTITDMEQPINITEAEMSAIQERARLRLRLQARRAIAELERDIKYQPE